MGRRDGQMSQIVRWSVLPIAMTGSMMQFVPAWAGATPGVSAQTVTQPTTPPTTARSPAIGDAHPSAQQVCRPGESVSWSTARPAAAKASTTPREAHPAAIQRELQRLLQQAEASNSLGSTPSSAQAAWQLGLIHLHGAGVRRDPALALQWFQRAARLGREPWAYAGLAWCAIDGCVGPPKVDEAYRDVALLRRRHPARADYLAWVLASRQAPALVAGKNTGQTLSPEVSDLALLQHAAMAGDVQANLELGIMAADDGRDAYARCLFERASPQSRAAEMNLRILENGGAMPNRASNPSPTPSADAQAAWAMAQRYHRRPATPANVAEAVRYYRLAAEGGSQRAMRMLSLIDSRTARDGKIDPGWMQQLAYVDPLASAPSLPERNVPPTQRDPTPLFDLMPAFWRQQLTQVER